jgi:hypothetical protein
MQCDKKSFLVSVDASKKRNLMAVGITVGGHTDNVVDLCGEDNVDSKRQYLGKIWSVMEDFSKVPRVKDFSKMKE